MLMFKMKIKAQKVESYQVFQTELENMCEEQNKFYASCEMDIAVAESIDPVQVSIFYAFIMDAHQESPEHTGAFACSSSCTV